MDIIKQDSTTEVSTKWIENLALEEINMEESGIVNFNDHLNPSYQLEESSINFMNQVRDLFEIYTHKFNQYRGEDSGSTIKIFKIANTINDFMLYRNSLRLIFARRADDLISIGFLSNGKDVFSARVNESQSHGETATHEIRAHIGPFNKIAWKFGNEDVDSDALVKHYLAEFIKLSAR
ncbi:MAG: hypothetical protein BM556_09815 [Bacteriovorax sp. MedPE-SWde]|nr:MAG: hypothetical protein BM556_09815 [Bacteriovorax sp. MedPE-SWde]